MCPATSVHKTMGPFLSTKGVFPVASIIVDGRFLGNRPASIARSMRDVSRLSKISSSEYTGGLPERFADVAV